MHLIQATRKIAVLRANGIGDYLFALPALEALRAVHPRADIVLLGLPWHADFLAQRPGPVNRVIVVPFYHGVREMPTGDDDHLAIERFFDAMAAERFDLALQLHGGGRYSNPFVRRLGAGLSVGFKTPDAEPLDRAIPYRYFQREVLRYLELVSLVGAMPQGLEPRVEVTRADVAALMAVAPDLEAERAIVTLCPGATDPKRRWPPEKFAAVAAPLAAEGARIILAGSPEDTGLCAAIQEALPGPRALDLSGRLTLGGLAALLATSRVVIANDSGPLHLARAVGASTVGIYWCGNVVNAGPMTSARHAVHLSWRLHCPECGVNCMERRCDDTSSFVVDVDPQEVRESASELFRGSPAAR